jgi:hypothetical protein
MDRQIPSYFGTVVIITNYDNGKLSERLRQHIVFEFLIFLNSQKAYPCNVPENCDEDSTKRFAFLIFIRVLNKDFSKFRRLFAAQNIVKSQGFCFSLKCAWEQLLVDLVALQGT